MHKTISILFALALFIAPSSPANATGEGMEFFAGGVWVAILIGLGFVFVLAESLLMRVRTESDRNRKWDNVFVLLLALALVAAVVYKLRWLKFLGLEGVFAVYLVARIARRFSQVSLKPRKPELPQVPMRERDEDRP